MMELKITLAMLLQRFHFSLIPNQRIDRVGLTGALPKNGIKMQIGPPGGRFNKISVRGNIHDFVELG